MEVDEGSDQNSDIQPHWMAAHVFLKNEFTEYEKYHNPHEMAQLIMIPSVYKVSMLLYEWNKKSESHSKR